MSSTVVLFSAWLKHKKNHGRMSENLNTAYNFTKHLREFYTRTPWYYQSGFI